MSTQRLAPRSVFAAPATSSRLLNTCFARSDSGVSLTGGKGSVWGVLLGGLVIASLDSGLNLMATDPYYVYVIKGAILLAAIGIDVVGKRSSEFQFSRLRQLSLKSLLRS